MWRRDGPGSNPKSDQLVFGNFNRWDEERFLWWRVAEGEGKNIPHLAILITEDKIPERLRDSTKKKKEVQKKKCAKR